MRRGMGFLWVVVLMLSGCASSNQRLMQPMPPLDSSLAAPCERLPDVPDGDEAALAGWMLEVVALYGVCAARHRETAAVWK